MSAIASTSLINRNSLLRSSVTGGLIIGMLHLIIQVGIVFGLLLKSPYISSLQFVASGAMGNASYTGGLATALLGLVLELLMTIIIAGIFIIGANRIPLLRQHVIPGSLLYGFGVFIVMNMIVTPLSATPPLPAPTTPQLIVMIMDHILVFGLLLGILVRRNANTNQ
jgi:hypothetical protein